MISLDTNLLARFLLADEPAQQRAAVQLLESGETAFVPVTVVLELAWVLRSRGTTSEEVLVALRRLLALPQLVFQHDPAVRTALTWAAGGLDLPDALHLALSGQASRFVTFDAALVRGADRLGTHPPVTAPPPAGC